MSLTAACLYLRHLTSEIEHPPINTEAVPFAAIPLTRRQTSQTRSKLHLQCTYNPVSNRQYLLNLLI